ncbi:MAG: DUF6754 domain-containing protein, partial [Anaerolineales bacterium]
WKTRRAPANGSSRSASGVMGDRLIPFGVLVLFGAALVGFTVFGARLPARFRPMPGFESLGEAIERAVEAGERVHVSLGTGSLTSPSAAPALAGLSLLSHVAARTSMSDRPAVVTAADGGLVILAQDTMRAAYGRVASRERYQHTAARMLGPTPFSYAATLPTLLATENVSAHILLGSFGAEGALAADFGRQANTFVLAGSDDPPAQALLYATAEHPLVGEEVFAGGAYLQLGALHSASLRAQDVIRLGLILAILAATALRTLGLI